MNKLSSKRFSLLGLVLLIVSAVTAAIIPSARNSDNTYFGNGHLGLTSDAAVGGQQSCYPQVSAGNCLATTYSTTSFFQSHNHTSDAAHSGGSVGLNTSLND